MHEKLRSEIRKSMQGKQMTMQELWRNIKDQFKNDKKEAKAGWGIATKEMLEVASRADGDLKVYKLKGGW